MLLHVLDMFKFWYYTILDGVHESDPFTVNVHKHVKKSGGEKDPKSLHTTIGQSEQRVQ
jgi:hypothetical protein